MKKIWFVTRSYPPMRGGGPFVRKQQVDFLRKAGYEVEVLVSGLVPLENPNTSDYTVISSNLNGLMKRLVNKANHILYKCKLLSDPLHFWAKSVSQYLLKNANKEDIVFLTSGGELSTPMIGHYLKRNNFDGKVVLNLHDLPDNALYTGSTAFGAPFPKYEKWEELAYLGCDVIAANSKIMGEMISEKYPKIKDRVDYFYFGFEAPPKTKEVKHFKTGDIITIGYIGTMSVLQGPEVLIKAWRALSEEKRSLIKLIFIGDSSVNPEIEIAKDVEKISYIPREDLLELMLDRVDLSFVSLVNKTAFRPLMSTKFYENIGLSLPVLGAFPEDCEAGREIVRNSMGWVCNHDNVKELTTILEELLDSPEKIEIAMQNLKKSRDYYNADNTMKRMVSLIERK